MSIPYAPHLSEPYLMLRHDRRSRALFASAWLLLAAFVPLHGGTVEDDWKAVTSLDAGPAEQPKSSEAASAMVLGHLAKQEKALRNFLSTHPTDAHAFEAQIRYARLLQIRADFEHSEAPRQEAKRILDSLEKTATPEQRPELEFAKIARVMRTLNRNDGQQCQDLLDAARRFQRAYPNDRRIAALLAEVASLFDNQPSTKEALLDDAQAVATEEDLKSRIADDLKRLHLMGQEIPLSFTSLQGQEITTASLAGKPTFIIFFGVSSFPSVNALGTLEKAVATLPPGSVHVIAVSLDSQRENALAALKSRGVNWPTAFDGKGWEGPLVRGFGINLLPTVWLLDGHGRLRSLNALNGAANLARQLLNER